MLESIVSIRPILVFGYGNPSRGDDAIGPRLIERLSARQRVGELGNADLLTDFQLQVEHSLDLEGREAVIFVDAATSGPEPFAFTRIFPERDATYTTHAMSPSAVLRVHQQTTGQDPPRAWLLAIRGYEFDLGRPLSAKAERNLATGEAYILGLSDGGTAIADHV